VLPGSRKKGQKVLEKRHVDKKGYFFREGFMEEKVVMDNLWIPADYASARKLAVDRAEVQPLHYTPEELEELYAKARRWLEEQDVK
jgi:hypothetical protein